MRVKTVYLALFAMLTVIFTGCTDTILTTDEELSKLSITLTFDNYNSRTIFPMDYNIALYKYKLTGQSTIGTSYQKEFEDSTALETSPIELSKSIWTLSLVACNKDDTDYTNPVLKSVVSVDLYQGSDNLNFILKPVKNGIGTIDIEGTVPPYDYIKGCKITLRSIKSPSTIITNSQQITDISSTKKFSYNKKVDAGQYNLVIELYTDTECTKSNCIGNESTIVVITNNSTTTKHDVNIANVLTKPDSPSDFAYTITGNIVTFTWNDNAYNEDAFIIDITQGEVTQSYSTQDYCEYSIDVDSGSFMQNSTSVSLSLESDTEYKAKLYSVNKAGRSQASTISQDNTKTELIFTL